MSRSVPFVDLRGQHADLRSELTDAMGKVLEAGDFVLGGEVSRFEEEFSAYCGVEECVGVASGLDALAISLRALCIGAGDEVILPANTFVATALAVSQIGARPVLVDVDPYLYNIDVEKAESAITSRTKAIIPVHLYGQIANMEAVSELAAAHSLVVLEDAAQAHGARQDDRRAGSVGVAGCFSFYPAKNLGACGDGGALVTSDPDVARKARMLRNYGSEEKYLHETCGHNSRLDTIQAAIVRAKLKYLDGWNAARRRVANTYERLLSEVEGVVTPVTAENNEHVFHLYVIQVDERDTVIQTLNDKGIGALIHYPIPVHLQPAYTELGLGEGSFPVTEMLAKRIVSLPMYPGLSEESIEFVCDEVVKVTKAGVR